MTIANRYKLLKRLGEGGFGEVWLAEDTMTGTQVALKLYKVNNSGHNELVREYRLVAGLKHPNLLTASYVGRDDEQGISFLEMDYCRYGSLENKIGNLTEKQIWQCIRDVSAGLQALASHTIFDEKSGKELAAPVVHQDIKPANILIRSCKENGEMTFAIADFGISKMNISQKSGSSVFVSAGTLAYMGPERFFPDYKPIIESDIWSLGAMLYELVERKLPFPSMDTLSGGNWLNQEGVILPKIANTIYSLQLRQLILDCLEKKTEDRPSAKQIFAIASEMLECKQDGRPLVKNDSPRFESCEQIRKHVDSLVENGYITIDDKDCLFNAYLHSSGLDNINNATSPNHPRPNPEPGPNPNPNRKWIYVGIMGLFVVLIGAFFVFKDADPKIAKEWVTIDDTIGYYLVQKNNKIGVQSQTGKTLVPIIMDSVVLDSLYYGFLNDDDSVECYFIGYKNGYAGVYTLNGKECLSYKQGYNDAYTTSMYSRRRYVCAEKNGKWGLLDFNGKNLIPCEYESIDANPCEDDSVYFVICRIGNHRVLYSRKSWEKKIETIGEYDICRFNSPNGNHYSLLQYEGQNHKVDSFSVFSHNDDRLLFTRPTQNDACYYVRITEAYDGDNKDILWDYKYIMTMDRDKRENTYRTYDIFGNEIVGFKGGTAGGLWYFPLGYSSDSGFYYLDKKEDPESVTGRRTYKHFIGKFLDKNLRICNTPS